MAALWVSIVTLLVLSWLVDEAAADAAAKETTRHTEDGRQGIKEYCQRDSFSAECPPGSLLLMTHARYGRMRTGKCISQKYGHVGCSQSVLSYMDKVCTGQQKCQVRVRNLVDVAQPCPPDLTPVLEADYNCIAMPPVEEACRATFRQTAQNGYLASRFIAQSRVGSKSCPWQLQLPEGQRVSVTLLDLSLPSRGNEEHGLSAGRPVRCPVYLETVEPKGARTVPLCGEESRTRFLFQSESNRLSIRVIHTEPRIPDFVIHYHAVGCAKLVTPADTMVTMQEDSAVVKCNNSRETWYLSCQGNRWIGEVGNCTNHQAAEKTPRRHDARGAGEPDTNFPFGIMVAVVIGIILGVAMGVTMLATVFCARRRLKPNTRQKDRGEAATAATESHYGYRADGHECYPSLIKLKQTQPNVIPDYECCHGNHVQPLLLSKQVLAKHVPRDKPFLADATNVTSSEQQSLRTEEGNDVATLYPV